MSNSSRWKALEEIQVGVCDGMSYDEVKQRMPSEFAARQEDKLRYRYSKHWNDQVRREFEKSHEWRANPEKVGFGSMVIILILRSSPDE